MENKYYTPDISDIRIGYKCECLWIGLNEWKQIKIVESDSDNYLELSIEDVISRIKTNEIRTQYLSKEQIEAEGWVIDKHFNFSKNNYTLHHHTRYGKGITIYNNDGRIYDGDCPSINEFKFICKLLNI